MITITAPPDDTGSAALAAAARMAVERLGGDGDGCALTVRLLVDDIRARSAAGVDEGDVTLRIETSGTEVVLTIRDGGAPIQIEPPTLHPLITLGVITGSSVGTDGHANVTVVRMALQTHTRVFDRVDEEIIAADAPTSTDEVTIRPVTPADAAGLTTLMYRCYGWSYPNTDIYFPERIAAQILDGSRIGEAAFAPDGQMVAHWGAVRYGPFVVESGTTATDPRFRHRGLAEQLGQRLLAELTDMGVIGRFREPVLTHPATQRIALKEGATIVGLRANCGHAIAQAGITDGLQDHRSSLTVAYVALRELPAAPVYVPSVYESILRDVLAMTDWQRPISAPDPDAPVPAETVSATSYDATNASALIEVTVVGADLIDEVDASLDRARRAGAKYIEVRLPTAQPALAMVGGGLFDLGLAYAAFLPLLRADSDALAVQWLDDPHPATGDWHYADERVERLAAAVLTQISEAADRAVRARRSGASH